ncbi:hypothetical protein EPUS_04782 [Endocarpon pusillum Z07020]|uniref:Kelch repeat protein n=1 Tax=Endocarpon pusillum (strain Z07020 / HMAS-L-300199) TaxID=1263415 RepID=U1HTZ0_ENDPU|nr:uncharacterized protein EPUS_04782 [Endocarpon pusillum Z07020]ERF72729.1 hypothetical protein EPUS_04782 [Endocarpon pusillum Z07020]
MFELLKGICVLLAETLYIVGGEFFYIREDGLAVGYPYNSTYSLDLSTSWSPKDVRFNMIDNGDSPVFNRPSLWPAPDGESFYSFNGDVSQAGHYTIRDPPPTSQLWQFTPDGKSNGTWSLAGTAPSLIQVQTARSTFGNGSAYILGGFTDWRTTRLYGYDNTYIGSGNGIVSYSMNSQTWQNQSMAGVAPTGWWYEGELHWVDNLGGSGLVVALGGVTAQPLPQSAGETLVPFDYVSFFNPVTGEWRNQSTTGAIPTPRRRACSVGVLGDNGTYGIILHGGSILPADTHFETVPQATIDLDQVWVLSLPSFTWYKSNYQPANARFLHTCNVPGNPPRCQMVAVGGIIPQLEYYLEPRDPWPQGLGIFDLTEMQWRDNYDANADAYETPRMVKDGIAKEGMYPKEWDSPEVPWNRRQQKGRHRRRSRRRRGWCRCPAGWTENGPAKEKTTLAPSLRSKNGYEKPELEAAAAPPGSTQTGAPQRAHNHAELNNDPLTAAELAAPNNRPVHEM